MGVLSADHDAAEPGNRIFAFEICSRVHLYHFDRFHTDIIGKEYSVLFHPCSTPGVNLDLFPPRMDHGETDFGIFSNIEFADSIVCTPFPDMAPAGAAGYDMELCPLFRYQDIMHVLDLF